MGDSLKRLLSGIFTINNETKVVGIAANSSAGIATSLSGAMENAGVNLNTMVGFSVTVGASSGSLYLRTKESGSRASGATYTDDGDEHAGEGWEIPAGGEATFAWDADSEHMLLYEASSPFFILTTHNT